MKWYSLSVFIGSFFLFSVSVFSQQVTTKNHLPDDYLSPGFHSERRQALRNLMPANSVAVIFAYPEAVFSRDVDYKYHPNPDLYYFSGYKEPNAVLFIFKEAQTSGDSSYNELFFVQHRDPRAEQWTGRRLGVEGVRAQLGFRHVYNGADLAAFPIDLKKFKLIMDPLPDSTGPNTTGELAWLAARFAEKSSLSPVSKNDLSVLEIVFNRGNAKNIRPLLANLKPRLDKPSFRKDSLLQILLLNPDSANLQAFKNQYALQNGGYVLFDEYTSALRGLKTPEELLLLKKSVELSSLAHAEAMRAANPAMSESGLEGIMLYVHKKYGAEDEGYPPIIGAGANGCILHYEENTALHVNNQLVLMDVGAEYHGYSADVTRTFPANGKFTTEQKAIYQLVYDAQEEAFKYCRAGITFDSLEAKTTAVLAAGLIRLGLIKNADEVRKYYPHGMTHHLGLDVHDKGDRAMLKENMVITIEPGIYIPAGSPCDQKWWDIGVRIEDDVVIGKDGFTNLSAAAPRKWEDVEKMVSEKSVFDGN